MVIDFSTPATSAALAEVCAGRGGPALVIGSTGFDAGQLAAIEFAALKVAIVRAGNFSLGLNILLGFVEQERDFVRLEPVDSGQVPVRENSATLDEGGGAMIRSLH